MKILIPFSGGINSTYSLYRWLTETDNDIIAIDMRLILGIQTIKIKKN